MSRSEWTVVSTAKYGRSAPSRSRSTSQRRLCGAASRAVPDADRVLVDGGARVLGRRECADPVAQARLVLRDPRAAHQRTAFIVGYLLIASTVLALVDGDLDSPGGAVGAAVALLTLAGLVVVVCRAMRAHAALRIAGRPERPWSRILRAPFFPGRLDVVRVRGLAYGGGPARTRTSTTAVTGRPARRATGCTPRLRHVRVHPIRRGQQGSGAVHCEGQHFPEVNFEAGGRYESRDHFVARLKSHRTARS